MIALNRIPANEEWVYIEQVVTFNTHPQMKLGFALGHNGSGGWWELQAYRVNSVLTDKDVDTSLVRATQLQNYSTTADTNKAVATATDALKQNLSRSSEIYGQIVQQHWIAPVIQKQKQIKLLLKKVKF